MDTDCGNTEMARDVMKILTKRRDLFCKFLDVLKEEFLYNCIEAALIPAQKCKNDNLNHFQKLYFGNDDSIPDYINNGRGDIKYILARLTPFTLEAICW